MSITSSDKHGIKRRKLSHNSNEVTEPIKTRAENGTSVTGSAKSAVDSRKSSQTNERLASQPRNKSMSSTGMTKASLMQVQVNELLEEMKPEYEYLLKEFQPLRDRIIESIKSLPTRSPLSLSEAEKILRKRDGVSIPFSTYRPASDVQYKFEYRAPDRLSNRGGITQRICAKDNLRFEIAIHMPSDMFQEKDYLNYRALHKRAYYLACIAAGIKEHFGSEFEIQYELQDGDALVPTVNMTPLLGKVKKVLQGATISLNAVLPHGLGSVEKMLPSKNCLRASPNSNQDASPQSESLSAAYNSAVRALASSSDIDSLIEQAIQKCEAFTDVCLLGYIWLRQRGFGSRTEQGGFGLYEWTYMCALFLTGGGHKGHPLFSDRYTSVQLFKAMLQVLATKDFTEPYSVCSQNLHIEGLDIPILFDGRCGVNVLSRMSKWSYNVLKHSAQLSLAAVNARTQENFVSTFITKVAEPNMNFDEIYTVDISIPACSANAGAGGLLPMFYEVVRKGLGDRVSLIDLRCPHKASWKLSMSEPKQLRDSNEVSIYLLVSPDAANRLIDHGPTAEMQEEARDFRKFWGEKSELRRFRDGSITETLVWSSSSPVIQQILQYLMAYHFKIPPSSITHETPDLTEKRLSSTTPITAEDAFKLIGNKYQELSSKLHQLEDIPLPIRAVLPAGQALRSSATGHPLDSATSMPIDMLVQFDSSARWPDNLLAIQHTKVAFLAKISDLVLASDSAITCRIGVENTDQPKQGLFNSSYLDIIYPSPAAGLSTMIFRLRIHHERELHLLQESAANASTHPKHRELAASAILQHKRTFAASPAHTSALRNLITHFQPLSATIRLLKAWIIAHNLSNHVPDAILEIIASRVFLQPYPWSTPGNATTAFLRCLHFLANWDWASSPLITDLSLSQDMERTQLTELETRYQAWRKLDPNMNTVAWFVGTNIDNTGTVWTQGPTPAKVIAGRVAALARAAMNVVKEKELAMSDEDWKNLFISSTSDFDFVIHIKSSVIRSGRKSGRKSQEVKFKNLQIQEDLDVDNIGYDLVSLFLEDLERAFGGTALFFLGERGKHIAGLWKPNVSGLKNWRVRIGYSTVPYPAQGAEQSADVEGAALINAESILAEIGQLGEGVIEKISVKQ